MFLPLKVPLTLFYLERKPVSMTGNTHNDTPHGAIAMLCTDTSPEQEKGRPGARAREGCARSRHLSKKKDGPARGPVKVVRGSVPEARIRTARRTAPERLCTKASRKQEKRPPGARRRSSCARRRPAIKNKDRPAHSPKKPGHLAGIPTKKQYQSTIKGCKK